MDPRRRHQRELVVLAVTILGLSRLLDGPLLWLVAALVLVAVWLGARQVIAEGAHGSVRVPLEASIVPAVMAAGSLGALRLVPLGLALAPVLLAVGLLVDVTLRLESRAFDRPSGMTAGDRTGLLGMALLAAFLAFTGVAAHTAPGSVAGMDGTANPGTVHLGIVCAHQQDGTSLVGLYVNDVLTDAYRDRTGYRSFRLVAVYTDTYPGTVRFDSFRATKPAQSDLDAINAQAE